MTESRCMADLSRNTLVDSGTGRAATMTIPGFIAERLSHTSSGLAEYHGYARIGTGTSDAGWAIKKLTYDSNDRMTSITWGSANGDFVHIWSNRTSNSYG